MSRKRVADVVNEMFDVMYQCSTPSISWYEILDEGEQGVKHNYQDHFLDSVECEGVYDEYLRRLPVLYRRSLAWLFLDYAPNSKKVEVIE